MPLSAPYVVLALATMLFAGACDDDQRTDPDEDAQRPDGGSGTKAIGGAGGEPNSAGASGAADAGRSGSSSGSGGTPMDGGGAGASGSAGSRGAAGRGGASATGDTGGPGAAGTGGSNGGSAKCPTGLEGAALVNIPAPDGSTVSSYCIDATEVTNAQYAAFLDASVGTTEQPEPCAWNTSYAPSKEWPASGKDDYPVANVDWCDAYAFCKWAGKRLCGKIGGGATDFNFGYDDATESEWFNACSAGETSTYSYGNQYDGTVCVGIDYDQPGYQPASDVPRAVATSMCVGVYGGLHDLSGNVWEWENSCDGEGMTDGCRMRGGASNSETRYLECDSSYDRARNFASSSLGFRCCTGAGAP